MALQKLSIVHVIEMIAGENQQRVDAPVSDVRQYLAHRVGSPLKPLRVLRGLLGRENLDEAVRELREAIRLRDVSIERRGVVLRQHEGAQDVGVDAVGERDVDEPVFTTERDCGFGALLRERKEAITGATAENDSQQLCTCRHDLILARETSIYSRSGGTNLGPQASRLPYSQLALPESNAGETPAVPA